MLFFVAASASFNGFYDKWYFRETGVNQGANPARPEFNLGLAEMLDGTAARPYVYRQLIPASANWLDVVVPERFKSACRGSLDSWMLGSPLAHNPAYSFRYFVVFVVTFLFAWLSVLAMYLVCVVLDVPPVGRVFAPVLMVLVLPYFLTIGGYYYDYPELAFLALAVWMGLKFDWWWMLPLVALGTWNKESFLLITLTLYPILRTRHSTIGALLGTGLLALTCAAVYFSIRSHYVHNPGGTVLAQWNAQLNFLMDPRNLIRRERTYGVTAFGAFSLLPLTLIAWTCIRRWSRLPLAIRRHGLIAAAINLPLFFLFCTPGELRDMSMLYIVFMLLLAANLTNWNEHPHKTAIAPALKAARHMEPI
jgi:hypothetical protein